MEGWRAKKRYISFRSEHKNRKTIKTYKSTNTVTCMYKNWENKTHSTVKSVDSSCKMHKKLHCVGDVCKNLN
jgi:hypothetical protein